ncbi:MAG: zinc ribbon domain-containing protein [Chloroflexi bacterium]|nr:zinc ribbon domain-containing protein [Chloroflexota bacterium]
MNSRPPPQPARMPRRASKKAAAAKRADAARQAVEISDDDIEAMIASRRKQHKSKSAGFCPKCGKPVLVTDKFCPSCGKALT